MDKILAIIARLSYMYAKIGAWAVSLHGSYEAVVPNSMKSKWSVGGGCYAIPFFHDVKLVHKMYVRLFTPRRIKGC